MYKKGDPDRAKNFPLRAVFETHPVVGATRGAAMLKPQGPPVLYEPGGNEGAGALGSTPLPCLVGGTPAGADEDAQGT